MSLRTMTIYWFEGQNFFDESSFRENPNPIVFFFKKKRKNPSRVGTEVLRHQRVQTASLGKLIAEQPLGGNRFKGVTLSKAEILQPGT